MQPSVSVAAWVCLPPIMRQPVLLQGRENTEVTAIQCTQVWSSSYHEASVALQGREEAVAAQAEAIETNLTLLGATAVEDRLQEGVPQAISTLSAAGIKVITHPAAAWSCLEP